MQLCSRLIDSRPRTGRWLAGGLVWLTLAVRLIAAEANAAFDTRSSGADTFAFIAAGDMRGFVGPAPAGKRYFDGVCESLQTVGAGALMISPGDCDPPGPIRATIDRYLGTNYLWYPVLGNHDIADGPSMTWLRRWAAAGIPHQVRRGPPGAEDTTYSFDAGNCHFVALNEYYDGRSDTVRSNDLPEATLSWLEQDLTATQKPLIWVFAHPPIKSLPDMDTSGQRHNKDSPSKDPAHLDRFVELLKQHHVRAYICGHTHCCSVERVKGVWQADSGHSRGGASGGGAPSTFLKFRVIGLQSWVDVYRADTNGVNYTLRKTVELN